MTINVHPTFRASVSWLALALFGLPAVAGTQDDLPTGSWAGRIDVAVAAGSRPVALQLELREVPADAYPATLIFGVPKQCSVRFKQAVGSATGWSLLASDASFGRCQTLIGQRLALRRSDNGGLALTMTGIAATLAPAASFSALPINGDWRSADTAQATDRGLQLLLDATRPGERTSHWRYEGARSCGLSAEFSGIQAGAIYLSLSGSNGGYCDGLEQGYVALTPQDGARLGYVLRDAAGALREQGTLRRLATGAPTGSDRPHP